MQPAFSQDRVFERATRLALSSLICLGRHTITGLLSTCGQQFCDWSATYRLFEKERLDVSALFDTVRSAAVATLPDTHPVVALLDDTLMRKRGRHVHGTSWRRDPLGPPFANTFIWAHRFLQTSLALPEQARPVPGPARAIPIDLLHCPSPRKPSRKASKEQWTTYEIDKQTSRISVRGAAQIQRLRVHLDDDPDGSTRSLIVCVDGSYTNRAVLHHLPARTSLIGRIRKDAQLHALPDPQHHHQRGRTPLYGRHLPTPEQLRQDVTIPWKTVRIFTAGRMFDVDIKSIGPVRWRSAGGRQNLRLIIVRPLAYRPHAKARLLYREPAYLISTDTDLDEQWIVQYYFWRWEIEVNFREEKTVLGAGEAQVRTKRAVETVPCLKIVAYACLLLAHRMVRDQISPIPRPQWQRNPAHRLQRESTNRMIGRLRADLWMKGIGQLNFSGFVDARKNRIKPQKLQNTLMDAVIYAFR
jgi:hypothetical protein